MLALTRARARRGASLAVLALLGPLALAGPAAAGPTTQEVVHVADDDNDGVYSVVLRDLETRRATTVLPEPAEGFLYDGPELSPDGETIVFSTDRGGAAGSRALGLAVVRRDGSGFRRLTVPPESASSLGEDLFPRWRPDGSSVLFTRLVSEGTGDAATERSMLMTVPASATSATTPTPLPGGDRGLSGDWSPDGASVVFADVDPRSELATGPLVVVRADGTGRRALGAGVEGSLPRWSPDGTAIAYVAVTDTPAGREDVVTQIATVPAAGGSATLLPATRPSSARTTAQFPSWTPDSEAIVFDLFGYDSAARALAGDLWAVDRLGTRAAPLLTTRGDEVQPQVTGPRPAAVVRPAGDAGTRYVPVTPSRVLDTRDGTGAPQAKVGPGGEVRLQVRGLATSAGAVPADAAAVVLNVTVTGPTAATDVRVYPSGTGVPLASNLNAAPGQTVPNLVTATIGGDGAVVLRNSGGEVHLIADLAGYYVPGAAGSGFRALDPARIGDTRSGQGLPGSKVPAGGVVDLQVTGQLGTVDGGSVTVPADATAVVLNVTGTGPTSGTDLRVYPTPTGDAVPTVSNLNLARGQTAANLVTVAVGQGGKVRVRNAAGAVDVVADLAGFYSPSSTGRFVPVVPTRFLDTRSGVGGAPVPVTAGATVDPRVADVRGVPADATAVALNLTGTGTTAGTDVRVFPFGATTVPTVSNLNLAARTTRANLAIVKTGQQGRVRIRNAAGSVNLIADLAGYFRG